MPDQNITIKFRATGNEALEQAIARLDIATKRLQGKTSLYEKELRKLNKTGVTTVRNQRLIHGATNKMGGAFSVLRSKLLLVSFAATIVNRMFLDLVKTFAAQEAVNKKLQTGLANVRGNVEGVTQRLIDYSAALQKTTAFGDEMITNGMVQLTTFGLNEKAIKSLTPQVLNVARAIQTVSGQMPDLNSLFIAFGKATSTAVSALTRYGVVLTDAEKAQLESEDANTRAVSIAKILEKQYGGLAEAYAKTTMGMLESAAAARGDAAEAFGEVLAPAVLAVSNALKVMAESMTPENIRAYGSGMLFGAAATTALAVATGRLNIALVMQSRALMATGWGAVVVLLGTAAGITLKNVGAFEDLNKGLEDLDPTFKELTDNMTIYNEEMLSLVDTQHEINQLNQRYQSLLTGVSEESIKEKEILQDLAIIKEKRKSTDADLNALTREELELKIALLLLDKKIEEDEVKAILRQAKQFAHFDKMKDSFEMLERQLRIFRDEDLFQNIVPKDETIEEAVSKIQDLQEQLQSMALSMAKNTLGMLQSNLDARVNAEISALKETEKYKNADAERRKDMERKVRKDYEKQQLALFRGNQLASIADIVFSTSIAIAKLMAAFPTSLGQPWVGMIKAMAGIQIALVAAQTPPKFATGGLVGGRSHAQGGTMIEAESGEFVMSRSAVESVGIENMNRINQGGGGVTVNVSGNVMTQDFVENDLAEAIKDAARRGTDFGIS